MVFKKSKKKSPNTKDANRWKQLSAFDLDKTLLKKNSSFLFGLYLFKQRYIPISALLFIICCHLRHSMGLLPINQLHETAFKNLFKGRSISEIQKLARQFIATHFEDLVYKPAFQALKSAKKAGHLTVIISSSPKFLVELFAKKFDVHLAEATEYAIDKDHRFCHIIRIICGESKASYMAQLSKSYRISKQNMMAYSDSHLDLPFLNYAGYPVGVNPNRKLRTICKKNHWPII